MKKLLMLQKKTNNELDKAFEYYLNFKNNQKPAGGGEQNAIPLTEEQIKEIQKLVKNDVPNILNKIENNSANTPPTSGGRKYSKRYARNYTRKLRKSTKNK